MVKEMFLTTYQGTELKTLISDCIKESLLGLDLGKSNIQEKSKQILTRQQVCNLLGISLPTLHSYTKEGLVKAFRLGHKVRYKYEDVIDALKQIKVGGKLCS